MANMLDLVMHWGPIVITAAAAAAAALPQPESQPWVTLRKLLDWAALNVGNAKNK